MPDITWILDRRHHVVGIGLHALVELATLKELLIVRASVLLHLVTLHGPVRPIALVVDGGQVPLHPQVRQLLHRVGSRQLIALPGVEVQIKTVLRSRFDASRSLDGLYPLNFRTRQVMVVLRHRSGVVLASSWVITLLARELDTGNDERLLTIGFAHLGRRCLKVVTHFTSDLLLLCPANIDETPLPAKDTVVVALVPCFGHLVVRMIYGFVAL